MIITILRKPLEGSVAENTLKHGCGALNIDATRVEHNEDIKVIKAQETGNLVFGQSGRYEDTTELKPNGRWPANFILVGDDSVQELDRQSGHQKSGVAGSKSRAWGVVGKGQLSSSEDGVGWKAYGSEGYKDEGGASRFFKQFKTKDDL